MGSSERHSVINSVRTMGKQDYFLQYSVAVVVVVAVVVAAVVVVGWWRRG